MSDSINYIGQVAVLRDLVSKPELNGLSVMVGLLNLESQRFATSTVPVQGAAPLSIAVKINNLEFSSGTDFISKYPDAPVVTGAFDQTVVSGSIVEFSECPEFNKKSPSWLLKLPSSIRGSALQSTTGDVAAVQFTRTVVVSMEEGLREPIEFLNINFDIPSKENSVHVSRGRNVTFKQCQFKSLGHGISIGDRNRLGDNAGKACVFFEDCVFEDSVGAGVLIAGDGHATLRRCVFRGNSKGIVVKDGGTAVLVDCTIEGGLVGIHLHDKGRSVDAVNCTVLRAENGLVLADGSTARVQNSTVSECSASGVDVHGGATSTTVTFDSSSVTQCAQGVVTHTGKVKVALNSCKLVQNTACGLCVDESSVGEVKVTGGTFQDNAEGNIMYSNNEKCNVTVDGNKL